MPDQNKVLDSTAEFKIRALFWPRAWLGALGALNSLLNFFSLRSSRRFWGVVYDSISKQPLDPAIVKLLYADSREVETCFTDLSGRYGFLARPGKFKIFARKSNYTFPSQLVTGSTDGIYENLYHGEFFILSEDNEVIAPNIPMDPEGSDWNQTAKLDVADAKPFWRLFFKKFRVVVFWFALVFCAVYLWALYPNDPWWLYIPPGFVLFLLISGLIIPEPRLWGKAKFNFALDNDQTMVLELRSLLFQDVISGRAKVLDNGKFLLRANPGKYMLHATLVNERKEKHDLTSLLVNIGSSGVFNSTIKFL